MSERRKKAGNVYDRLFKENARDMFLPLIKARLEGEVILFRPLEPKLQKTLEREVDLLYEVAFRTGEAFLLHVEFQSDHDPNMLYRMSEYHSLILNKYKKPIRHFVIHLGASQNRMNQRLKEEEDFAGFELVDISTFDHKQLLLSQVPEELLLTVLADYPKERMEEILRSILVNLKKNRSQQGSA